MITQIPNNEELYPFFKMGLCPNIREWAFYTLCQRVLPSYLMACSHPGFIHVRSPQGYVSWVYVQPCITCKRLPYKPISNVLGMETQPQNYKIGTWE